MIGLSSFSAVLLLLLAIPTLLGLAGVVYLTVKYTPVIIRIFQAQPLFMPLKVTPVERGESVDFQTGFNLLKVQASELAVATVMSAMQACGLSGYRNDGDFSIGRHLRDILSSPIMISNDRIIANVGTASLLTGAPASLRE